MGTSLSKNGVEDIGPTYLIRKIGTNVNNKDDTKRIQVYDENFTNETSLNSISANFKDENEPISEEKRLNFGPEKYFYDKKVFFNGISNAKNGEIDKSTQLNPENRVILEEHNNLVEVKLILNELINEVCHGMESSNGIQLLLEASLSHSDKRESLKVLDELINEFCDLNNEDDRNSQIHICDCSETEETYDQAKIKAFLDAVLNEACSRLSNENSKLERLHEDYEIKVILDELVDRICILDAENDDKQIQ